MLVPQVEQVPFLAGLPFLRVTSVGFTISDFFLHFTQYASTMNRSEFGIYNRFITSFLFSI